MTFIEAGDLLWQPQNPEKTQIYQFASHIKTQHGFDWHEEYEQLWQWSVDAPDIFWSALWDWHGVIGDKGTRKDSTEVILSRSGVCGKTLLAQSLARMLDVPFTMDRETFPAHSILAQN